MKKQNRMQIIDTLRGITIISMVIYHLCWDLVYKGVLDASVLNSAPGVFWQRTICCSFILISGFCISLGSRPFYRGALLLALSLVITAVTTLFMPQARIVFGVLTLLGLMTLITAGIKKLLPDLPGFWSSLALTFFSLLLFALTYRINSGSLGLFGHTLELPSSLYHGLFMTLLGFMDPDFFSTDYFSLIPWGFLYLAGFFLYPLANAAGLLKYLHCRENPFSFLGRHSLLIYLLHQPLIFLLASPL